MDGIKGFLRDFYDAFRTRVRMELNVYFPSNPGEAQEAAAYCQTLNALQQLQQLEGKNDFLSCYRDFRIFQESAKRGAQMAAQNSK